MAVADRCSVLRKGKYIGPAATANTPAGGMPGPPNPRQRM